MLSFAIFKAKEKKSDKSPDYTSGVKVENKVTLEPGVEYQLAGWIRESKNGVKYISVQIKPKDTSYQKSGTEFDTFLEPPKNQEEPF